MPVLSSLSQRPYPGSTGIKGCDCGKQQLTGTLVDKYRNKMKETLVAGGQEVSTVAPYFDTRVGKRRWLERKGKGKRGASP